jgi:hypothetical protein
MSLEVATLVTGREVPAPLVMTTTIALRALFRDYPTAFYAAVTWARSGEPQAFSAERLEAIGLTQNGTMHDAVRDVIAASAEGEGFDLHLVNPLRREAA